MSQPATQWKRWLYLGLGTAITCLLLTWVLRDVSWRAVGDILGQSQWGWFGVGWVAYVLSYGVRAYRWGTLLAGQPFPSTLGQRLAACFIGYGSSSILPAYLGEVFRAGILNRSAGIPVELSLGSIFAERILDIGVVLMCLGFPLAFGRVPALSGLNYSLLLGLCAVLLGLWLCCLLGARNPKQTVQRLAPLFALIRRPRLQARLVQGVSHFLEGLTALSHPQRGGILLLQTLTVWLLNGVTYWTGLLALSEYRPGFMGALFIQSGTALAIALPSSPGYIGPFEASLQMLLGLYQISHEVIVSYAIALRFLMYVSIPLLSVLWLFKLGLRNQPVGVPSSRKWQDREQRDQNTV